jgi:hypothetical protein
MGMTPVPISPTLPEVPSIGRNAEKLTIKEAARVLIVAPLTEKI